MTKYILKRLFQLIPVIFLVSIIVFMIMHALPGDPISLMLAGAEGGAITPERKAELAEALGLNDPLIIQYFHWIGNACIGNLGESIRMRQPVSEIIKEFFTSTFHLSLVGLGFSLLIGLLTGIFAALKQNSWFDFLTMAFSYIGNSMPVFWLGLMLLLFFSFKLKWLPSAGGGTWQTLILPGLLLVCLQPD